MGKGKNAGKGKAPEQNADKKRKRAGGKGDVAEEKKAGAGEFSLFGGVKDAELDDVFSKSTALSLPVTAVASSSKLAVGPEPSRPAQKKSKKEATPDEPDSDSEADLSFQSESEVEQGEGEGEADSSSDDEIDDPRPPVQDEESSEEESDGDEDEFVHESVKAKAEKKEKKASALGKYVPPGETAADKDRRTVFVGNLPIEAAKSKSILHQLRQHLLSFVPSAKIESVRFRSVAFASATSALPTDDPEKDANQRVRREKERTAAWRSQQESGGAPRGKGRKDEDEDVDRSKVFIDAKGKRKVAFIKKDFHSELASCNAYVVFAHPHPERSANVAPIMDPFEAATAVLAANTSTFLDRTIRVDSLRLPSAIALATAGNALAKRDAWLPKGTDPKKSLFVGGLDYATKDEDLRVFFEELVKAERGPAEVKWVTGVRIVRDNETQLGKGFGYVHFSDRESVEEVLAMDASKIKFAKRTIRVQPCKTLPSATTLNNTIKKMASTPADREREGAGAGAGAGVGGKPKGARGVGGGVPRGNPKLGEKIKDLSKEERKVVKSADSDRQARRLAKKKAKHSLDKDKDKGAVKLSLTKAERERTKGAKPKAKKGKIRGPNAIAKMKGSRA